MICERRMIISASVCPKSHWRDRSPHLLRDDRRVSHVLNRLCFGPRPGDHARVTALGVPQFFEEQLNPEAIDDRVCEAMVRRFEGLAELADGGSRRLEKLTRGSSSPTSRR
jgi:hypothetical protein